MTLKKQKHKETPFDWVCPEHYRDARAMDRDYPRDEMGNKLPDSRKQIVVDVRPTIMVPPRPTRPAPPL